MIQCMPEGIYSWCFSLTGKGVDALPQHEWLTEAGKFELNGVCYLVDKKGLSQPRWEVVKEGRNRG